MVRVAAIADQHGNLGIHCPEADLLILGGDHFPYYSTPTEWAPEAERSWCEYKFSPWLHRSMENIQSKKGVYVPGNHCILPYVDREWFADFLQQHNITLLDDHRKTLHIEGLKIGGYPYTHGTLNWAYNRKLDGTVDEIPEGLDIFVPHSPPLGFLDTTQSGQHRGSPIILHQLLTKSPMITLCGHIHEHRGRRTLYRDLHGDERKIINISAQGRDGDNKGAKMTTFTITP